MLGWSFQRQGEGGIKISETTVVIGELAGQRKFSHLKIFEIFWEKLLKVAIFTEDGKK